MAFTSNLRSAGSDGKHAIELRARYLSITKKLYNLPKDDYEPNKGDLWKLSIKHYFGFTQCIRARDINYIKIREASNDGWNIESVVTFVIFENRGWQLSSVDLNVNQWIDGNELPSHKEFKLNLVL